MAHYHGSVYLHNGKEGGEAVIYFVGFVCKSSKVQPFKLISVQVDGDNAPHAFGLAADLIQTRIAGIEILSTVIEIEAQSPMHDPRVYNGTHDQTRPDPKMGDENGVA